MNEVIKIVKIGAVFLAGYYIGFNEFKYKATKAIVEVALEKDSEEKD